MSKILYAASTMSHINSFHTDYISRLIAEGHEVYTMARGEGADFNIPFEKKLFAKGNKECRKRIRKIIESEAFDLIILNTSLAAFHIRWALPKHSRPRVLNIVHGYLFNMKEHGLRAGLRRRLLLTAERLMTGRTDAILTMNEEDFKIASKYRLTHGTVTNTLGMGIKERNECSPYDARPLSEDSPSILFVGELSGRKNQELLIRALPLIQKSYNDASLWLVGEGGCREALASLADELGVEEKVIFLGRREDVTALMKSCSLYASASKIEGLPFNIVEALGAGATVLASDIKGHRDILSGGGGFLFKKDSKEALAELAIDILDGKIQKNDEEVKLAYKKYSFDSVFSDTYEKIKEAGNLV